MTGTVVFLSGPVGAGKTTLGRALAGRLGGGFIDGDDHQVPGRPWFGCILSTSRSIGARALSLLGRFPVVVVAYPLRRREWLFHRRHFGRCGVRLVVASLRATPAVILAPGRGRAFSPAERDRVAAMVAEGYGDRPFGDVVVDTDGAFADALDMLERGVRDRVVG